MKLDLDKQLLAMEKEMEEGDDLAAFREEQRQKRLAEARRKRSIVMGVGTVAALAVVALLLPGAEAPEDLPVDHAADWSHVAPFAELHALDGGWIGVLPSRWDGDAAEACHQLLGEAELEAHGTVTLLDDGGLVLAECGGDQ